MYSALQRQGKEMLIETTGKKLRSMMSWVGEAGLDIDD
jgi:ketol-acid reductoisomerase